MSNIELKNGAPVTTDKSAAPAPPEEKKALAPEELKKSVVAAITAIKDGPRAMQLYMDTCVKCGTCATVCPVYFGKSEKRYNPAERTDLIRRIYRKHATTSGKLLGKLAGAEDFDP